MRQLTASFLLFTISFLPLATPALAQSSDTPIASTSQELLDKTYEDVLQKAKENVKQTEEKLDEKADKSRLIGHAGTISDIKQGVFSVDSRAGTIQISYDANTAIVKDGAALKPELMALGDSVIIIGTQNGNDIIAAKRIVIIKKTAPKYTKQTIFSPIIKIDAKKKMLTLSVENKNQQVALGKLIKFDLAALSPTQKIFGIIMISVETDSATLIQGKMI